MNEMLTRARTPQVVIYALALGHTAWGVTAYGDQLAGIVSELPGSVGDGIFDKAHSRDERAAAFWFLFVGPMLGLFGRTYGAAEEAGDRAAMRAAGRSVIAICATGCVTTPRSGFPAGLALGIWLTRRARH